MSLTPIYPREEQIAELTRGQRLPLAPLAETLLVFIAEMLRRAWDELLRRQLATLVSGGETEVNTMMETRLNALLEEDELWSRLVRCVTRGTEEISYDGSHLEKRPDLSIHLTRRNPSFPLVVECKLLDAGSGKKTHRYCDDGLGRFVRGEYAWATREAFMLAYVRDGSTILSHLKPFLADSRMKQSDVYLTEALPASVGHSGMDLARSKHSDLNKCA